MSESHPAKPKRGFAAMDAERRRALASRGGQAVPAEKRAYARCPDLASRAGRAGGRSTGNKRLEAFLASLARD